MAIDTAEKRRAASILYNFIPGITPNVSKDVEWRCESGYSYYGFLTPVVPILKYVLNSDVGIYISNQDSGWYVKDATA